MSNKLARFITRQKLSILAASVMVVFAASAGAQVKEGYAEYEGGPQFLGADDGLSGSSKGFGVVSGGGFVNSAPLGPSSVGASFKGVSQFDLRNFLGGSFIPPDTMGAVGTTQFMETTNGVYAIYDKTGGLQSMVDARTFWQAAGMNDGSGLNGDARVLFDKTSQKWIALQFGLSISDIQIAVSTTDNALGPWKSTKFTGFAGGIADFPTLAIDAKGVYIGTNNFSNAGVFQGTTLNVIARSDLFGAAPTAANVKQFNTPYPGIGEDRGFAIQGVNGSGPNSGLVIAASLFFNDSLRYNVNNPGTAGATLGAATYLGLTDYVASNGKGRQPDGTRNIDTGDQRIGSNAWENDGKIYSVYTATPLGGDHTQVRWIVIDELTNAIIQEGTIGDADHDYFYGSIAVNGKGQVVIGYNRSGYETEDLNGDGLADGNVSFFARTYNSDALGQLFQTDQLLLHVSTVSDYHNGSFQGQAAAGRQRWGDYAAVTLDPNDIHSFWAIGEYAEVWNNVNGCSPGDPPGCTQTGGSSWGTWIAQIKVLPEPQTYVLIIAALLALGATTRRRKSTNV